MTNTTEQPRWEIRKLAGTPLIRAVNQTDVWYLPTSAYEQISHDAKEKVLKLLQDRLYHLEKTNLDLNHISPRSRQAAIKQIVGRRMELTFWIKRLRGAQ